MKEEKLDNMQALMVNGALSEFTPSYSSFTELTSAHTHPQSRMVCKENTHFFWTSRRDDIDCRLLQHDQIINHYTNAAAFATKVPGLTLISVKSFSLLASFFSVSLSLSLSRWVCA